MRWNIQGACSSRERGRRVQRIARLSVDDLCLNKKIAERRMQRVCGRRCKDDLRVTRDLDLSACSAAVGDRDPAQLDIILGRNS